MLAWAVDKANEVSDEVFYFTTCAVCHQVIEKPVGESTTKWDILPVNIAGNWFPIAHLFHHQSHEALDCVECHNKTVDLKSIKDPSLKRALSNTALPSTDSQDVLMPSIEVCKTCHSSQIQPNKIGSSCLLCHGFHVNSAHRMGEKLPTAVQDNKP
jgi:cytochrome c553